MPEVGAQVRWKPRRGPGFATGKVIELAADGRKMLVEIIPQAGNQRIRTWVPIERIVR